jgi:predicted metal-dependent peptidase
MEAIAKARAELIQTHVFYGVLVSQVEPVATDKVPTMATNGRRHFVNPSWIMGLKKNWKGEIVAPQKLRLGVQRHESEHDARGHHSRRGERDPVEWNKAADYNINIDLVDEMEALRRKGQEPNFDLVEGALVDARFRGWSAEEIYRARELDKQKEEQQRRQQEQQQSEESEEDDEEGESEAGDNSADEEQGQDEEVSGTPDGSGQGSEEAEEGDDETEGQGSGSEENGDQEGSEGEGEALPQSSGDPGGMGEVLDASEDLTEMSEEAAKWERIAHQAAILAEKRGQLPGHVTRDIEANRQPKQSWREVLRAWVDQGGQRRETWSRGNRRFIGQGIYLPSQVKDGVNHVALVVDTSGSMDAIALAAIRTELQSMLDEQVADKLTVVYIDTQITRVDEWSIGDELVFDPRGGGGTELAPAFRYIEEELEDVSLIIGLTDNYTDIASGLVPPPSANVLWAFTGFPDAVKQHMANPPWGAPAVDIGQH